MKTISIKQPWASLIAHGIKDVENRTWQTKYRGEVLIHTSAKLAGTLFSELSPMQKKAVNNYLLENPNALNFTPTSVIIGKVEIVDCVQNFPSVWSEVDLTGTKPIWNWVLRNPVLFSKPIFNVKGKLNFWDFDDSLLIDV
ncbi:MAG TPA: ASCH domain-containing protein [Brumimicrobium sp.]|nr:ASCH domain-containing protein [Brumimicrobium sp.]